MKTVLIFAHECAPYHRPQSTIGAQRPAQFAKQLPRFGWRVIIVCCAKAHREQAQLEDLAVIRNTTKALLTDLKNELSVLIPTPSLTADGWLDRAWRANRGRPKVRRLLTAAKFFTGDWSQSWQPCARAAAEVIAKNVKVDVVIAEHGPDAGIFLARWFARQYGVPWVADLRDPLLRPFRGIARRVYAWVARYLLKTAAGTVAVTPVWAELDRKLLGRQVWCIPNGYDPAEFVGVAEKKKNKFIIAFAGNIRETFDIFIEGLRLLRERLNAEDFAALRFCYWGVAYQRVREMAEQAGVEEVVETQPHIERAAILQTLSGADLLLLLTLPDASKSDPYLASGLYPGKLFEYWGARRPVLCVPSDGGLLDDLLYRSRTGVSVSTAAEVADYLAQALRAWQSGKDLPYQPDEAVLAGFTREHLAQKLAQVLDEVALR